MKVRNCSECKYEMKDDVTKCHSCARDVHRGCIQAFLGDRALCLKCAKQNKKKKNFRMTLEGSKFLLPTPYVRCPACCSNGRRRPKMPASTPRVQCGTCDGRTLVPRPGWSLPDYLLVEDFDRN